MLCKLAIFPIRPVYFYFIFFFVFECFDVDQAREYAGMRISVQYLFSLLNILALKRFPVIWP